MSGGVDSSVAAALLKQQGYEVIGAHMQLGRAVGGPAPRPCCTSRTGLDACRVAAKLDIPFHIFDLEDEFREIISYFCREYDRGRTPNPCILCNRQLKFGRLLVRAEELGCSLVATGHYARVVKSGGAEEVRLFRASDRAKDQSYVLFSLRRTQLRRALFPLGELSKREVRLIASELGLHVQGKPESQDICFAPGGDYRLILDEFLPGRVRPGVILDSDGREIGTHEGYQLYTIGQRRKIGAHAARRYVVRIDAESNTLIVGPDAELHHREFTVSDVNWIASAARDAFEAVIQIRSQHKGARGTVEPMGEGRVRVRFAEPQRAITPGQAAVFYRDDEVLGGGWIESVGA